MFNFLVTAEGGLTTAGYVVSVIAVLILVILVAALLQKNTSALKLTTQQLVTCAVALALAYVTSYIKLFKLPFGGSVTLFSMLFIVLIGYWYGVKVGIPQVLYMEFSSSFRSHMSFPFSRYAVIISWHLDQWDFPDYLQNPRNMAF